MIAFLIQRSLTFQLIYLTYGTKDVVYKECKDLDGRLELKMDGQRVDLPQLESLVVLNIPYWGAGVQPWTMGNGNDDEENRRNKYSTYIFCRGG